MSWNNWNKSYIHNIGMTTQVGTLSIIKCNIFVFVSNSGKIINSCPQNFGKLINRGWNKSGWGLEKSQKLIFREGTSTRYSQVYCTVSIR